MKTSGILTPHQRIAFGQASHSNHFDLNQQLSSLKGSSLLSVSLPLSMLVDAVDVLAFFYFFLISCSIQLSVTESPFKSKLDGWLYVLTIYTYLKRTSCNHCFCLRSLEQGLINKELKKRLNISTLYNMANCLLVLSNASFPF